MVPGSIKWLDIPNIIVRAKHGSRLLIVLGCAIGVSILIAACGAAPSAPDASNSDGAPSRNPTTEANPLAATEEFGLSMEELVRNSESVEGVIAECMNDAGFEYVAVDFDTVRRGMRAEKTLPGMTEDEYVAQYGYGVTTFYTGQAPHLADPTSPARIGLGEQNVEIFNSLPPADQAAYSRTLLGERMDSTFALALEVEDFSRTGGCTRSAIEQVFSAEQLAASYQNPKDAIIAQDPRMIAALEEYADCLHSAGLEYSQVGDVENDLKDRLDSITNGLPLESLSSESLAALGELQSYEREVAPIDYECEGNYLDDVAAEIENELYAGIQR